MLKSVFKLAKTLSVFGQLGFALITPPVSMSLLGWWLTRRFGLGVWVIAVALLLGMLTAGASAWNFWKKYRVSAARKTEQDESAERPVTYYRHE